MVESQVVDLASFGKSYRSLFIIGEYECCDSPGSKADRLNMRGRLLLTDFVSGFYEIRKATKSAEANIRSLKIQAYRDLRIITDCSEASSFGRDISQKLREAHDKLNSDGAKKLTDLAAKILEYRDEIVAPEVDALEAKVRGLEEKSRSRGRIAAMANKIKLSFERGSDTPHNQVADINVVKSELSIAQGVAGMAAQTRTNMNSCTAKWRLLHSTIQNVHHRKILKLLDAEITQQSRGDINDEFQLLLNVIQDLTKQMDSVYEDIEAQFGADGDINKRVGAFLLALPHVSDILDRFSSSHNIIEKSKQEPFLKEIRNLAKYSLAQLYRIEGVLGEWITYIKSESREPLSFIDDAHKMSTKTTEFFERNWHTSSFRLRVILESGKKRTSKKGGDSNETRRDRISAFASSCEALHALEDLEETFFAITGFSIRFAMDLMFYDRRLQDDADPESLSELLVNPFAVDQDVAEKAYEVLADEVSRLKEIVGPDAD